MKKGFMVMIVSLIIGLSACSKGNEINGRSLRTAQKSVSYIKDRLPPDQAIEFQVSFWSLRDAIKDKDEFLDKIDGKKPEELIEMGKALYQERKAAGFKGYEKFDSWDHMIAAYSKERIEQSKNQKSDPRDRANSVIYNLPD